MVFTNAHNPNLPTIIPIGEGFGFVLYFDYPNFNSKRKNDAPGLSCQE